MIRRILLYIRSKPKIVRTQYAFVIASIFTGITAFVWIFNQPAMSTPSLVDETQGFESTFFSQVANYTSNQAASIGEAWERVVNELEAEQATTSDPVSTTSVEAVSAPDFTLTADNINQVQARLSEVATVTPESMPLGTAPNQPTTNETPPAATNLTENETNRPSARPVQIIITNNNQVATTTTTP